MMKRLLQINSSIFSDQGASSTLANRFVQQWQQRHSCAEITRRDLAAEPIAPFDGALIQAMTASADERTAEQQARVELADQLIAEVQAADVLVLGAPMYNFAVPTQLKTWFDHIARAGTTFHYTANGPEGLLTGKRAYVFTSRGGLHRGQPSDFVTGYVRQFLGFVGIADMEFVHAEGLNLGDEARASAMAAAEAAINSLVPAQAA